jgi:glycosyltransferase involved in cell wall biosynthesis
MPDWPLVSVVVPVYQGERFLEEALWSALSQSRVRVELIVVDDGSTDAGAAIAEPLATPHLNQPNGGVSAARHAGIEAARGDMIALLDQDDVFEPSKLALQADMLQADPELDFVIGRLRMRLEPGSSPPAWWNPAWDPDGETAIQLGTTLIRRRAFDTVGGFDERYAIAGDTDWIARAKDAPLRWRMHDDVVLTYRVHGDNNMNDQERMRAELLQVMHASVKRQRAVAK